MCTVIGISFCSCIAGVYELIPEKSKEDIVEVLKRAHGLFVKLEGANSFHALQTLESIQNIEKGMNSLSLVFMNGRTHIMMESDAIGNRKTVGQILSVDNRGLDEDGLRVTSENKINGKKPENGLFKHMFRSQLIYFESK